LSNAGDSNYSITLNQAARGYQALGFSVIPVHSDTKAAAVPWKLYQQRQATEAELGRWFQRYTGLGIVTGAVSRLLVLDFDDPHLYQRFRRAYPDLSQTYTVRTRRGWHLYYRLPAGFTLRIRSGQGIDLKAEGGMVVAPPTVIDGHTYTLSKAVPPQNLSEKAIESMLAFFAWSGPDIPEAGVKGQEGAFSCEIEASSESYSHSLTPFVTSHDLVSRYRCYARQDSRNDTLFNVSLYVRDHNGTVQQAIDSLADLHARQPANGPHRPESYEQRYREAVATILSAFSRPPRRPVEPGRAGVQQLPNAVREALFQRKQTYTVRVIEGLRLAGVQPGQAFTTNQALKLLKGRVGRDSIYNALKAASDDGQAIFASQTPSPEPPTPKTSYADSSLVTDQTKECSLVGPKNQEKGRYHRPARVFIMPSNEALCLKLGVRLTGSDTLTEDDLASAKQTRLAAHREFIRRRPGMYPRRWLARRLGICTDTLDAYNHEIPIHVQHCYFEKVISWSNLDEIPLALAVEGLFLEDDTGKRYPARREIARKLLAHKRNVTLKRQDINFYWYDAAPVRTGRAAPGQPDVDVQPVIAQPAPMPAPPPAARPPDRTSYQLLPARQPYRQHECISACAPVAIPDSAAAQERMAERAYTAVSRLSTDNAQHISQTNARKLVETYGTAAVEQGLKRLRWYAGKGRVERPAGFLVTAARAAWHGLHPQAEPGAPAPRFQAVRRRSPGSQ
jgi:hypothetical protein